MKKYRVNVNGTTYEVEVEEMEDVPETASRPAMHIPTEPMEVPGPLGRGEFIESPMPGNILSINVRPGDLVKQGQVLMILEAMKMENEIMCPRDGKVVAVDVVAGSTVEAGARLMILE